MVLSNNYKIDWLKLHTQYLAGKTLTELAKELNCSYQNIANNFRKNKLKIFTLSEANKRSKKLKRGCNGKTRAIIKINSKRILLAHYNYCVANNLTNIPKNCVIHHLDNNRHNDAIENLMLLTVKEHKSLHYQLELTQNPKRKYWGINKIQEA